MKYLKPYKIFEASQDELDESIRYIEDIMMELQDLDYSLKIDIIEPNNRYDKKRKLVLELKKEGNKFKSMWSVLSEVDDALQHLKSYISSVDFLEISNSMNSLGVSFSQLDHDTLIVTIFIL